MSYSFNVRAGSKDDAREMVKAKLGEVVEAQPVHAHDRATAEGTVDAMLGLIGDAPEGQEFSVSVHGSCWERDGVLGGVSVGVDVSHQAPIAG